jgi:hypothetical protein
MVNGARDSHVHNQTKITNHTIPVNRALTNRTQNPASQQHPHWALALDLRIEKIMYCMFVPNVLANFLWRTFDGLGMTTARAVQRKS